MKVMPQPGLRQLSFQRFTGKRCLPIKLVAEVDVSGICLIVGPIHHELKVLSIQMVIAFWQGRMPRFDVSKEPLLHRDVHIAPIGFL